MSNKKYEAARMGVFTIGIHIEKWLIFPLHSRFKIFVCCINSDP